MAASQASVAGATPVRGAPANDAPPANASPPDAPPMRRDMARQPQVAAAILSRADAFVRFGREALAPGPGGRLHVCGCGDGLFAAQIASGHAEALGLDWRAIGALDLVLSAGRLRPVDRVLCISMSGNVDRTVEAAKAAARAGAPLAALVNGGGGRLGAVAAVSISLDLADVAPFLCGTASHTATVLALLLIAEGAASGSGTARPDALADLPARVAGALAASDADWNAILDPAPSGVRVLSAGASIGAAAYGAAKLVELTRTPAWSADLEEFAHSQYWAMPASDLAVILATEPGLARHADDACDALAGLGVRTLAIAAAHAPVPAATFSIALPSGPEHDAAAPILATLPLQRLAYELSRRTGLDPNTRLHLKNDEARFRVSRLLTRRSLLGTGQ